jgi:hypothetical protein
VYRLSTRFLNRICGFWIAVCCFAGGLQANGNETDADTDPEPAVAEQETPTAPGIWSGKADSAWIFLPDALPGRFPAPAAYRDPRKVLKPQERVTVNGYVRFFGFNRNMDPSFQVIPSNPFANTPPYVIGVGDVYRDPPLMLLNIGARPTSATYIGMDFALPNFFTGDLDNPRNINLNLGINLIGSFNTEVGRFAIQAGGINWTTLSPLTYGAPEIFRFSLFERSPWDGNATSIERIDDLFQNGRITVDERFGRQAFKGFLFDGTNLPGGFEFRALYGNSPVNANLTTDVPSFMSGGYLRKVFTKGFIAYNTVNYINYIDSVAELKSTINLHTVQAQFDWDGWKLKAEGGVGRVANAGNAQMGEGIRVRVESPKRVTGVPISVELYRLNQNFTNFFGSFLAGNANISGQTQSISGVATGTAASFAGSITDVGQFANNQQGIALNTDFGIGDFKMNVGLQASQELERVSNRLSWGHRINALPFSRFVTFSNGVGPYGRWNSFFRGVAEDMTITRVDTAGLPIGRNGFNTLQVQAVYKVDAGPVPIYATYLVSLGSVQNGFSPVPIFGDSAYLRAHYHEADLHIGATDRISLIFTYGREWIRGNQYTNRGDNVTGVVGEIENDPLNQRGRLIGAGLDIKASETVGVYFRHRRFRQQGESFTQDNISGHETTAEIKIFF